MSTLVRFFQMGGFFMFPIVIVLAVGLAIAIERWVHLNRVKDANKKTGTPSIRFCPRESSIKHGKWSMRTRRIWRRCLGWDLRARVRSDGGKT